MTTEAIIAIVIAIIFIIIIFIISAIAWVSFRRKKMIAERNVSDDLYKEQKKDKQKMYEVEILNELGSKMDYSFNIQSIIEVITESLSEFIDYSVVSYMILRPEKIIFKSNLKKSVSREFINNIKNEMLDSISTLLNVDLKDRGIEERLFGVAVNEEADSIVGSFFNIPLVVNERVVGLLTVADTKPGFYNEEEMTALYSMVQQATQAVTRLQKIIDTENSKLNAMVSSMTDGVIMTNMDYEILVANPAAKKAMNLEDKNDLSISDFADRLTQNFDLKDKIVESLRLERVFVSDEISLLTGFFKVIVSPVKDKWRNLGCAIVFRDITKEKEVERIKEDFTSMIVHELRSPLDSIKKMTEMMRVSDVNKAKRAACFQMIYGSSSDMLELINNLLDIAKIEAGKFELMKQKSDIKKVIDSRILFFDIAAKDAKVNLASFYGKEIPENIEFDPHTVSQVLNNLLSNAIKFTKEDGTVTVQAMVHKNAESIIKEAKDSGINWFIKKDIANIPDSIVVAVTDNGAGIPADQIDKLFNKFVQAKRTFVSKGGTGLGLAIVKSIIDSHGGTVGVESIEGQGSTFYFTLPINN